LRGFTLSRIPVTPNRCAASLSKTRRDGAG
jgi:hypothetical protein